MLVKASVAPVHTGCAITDTAKSIGVAQRTVFDLAARAKGFSNPEDCAEYRYLRWFKYNEIPTWVLDYISSRR